MNFSNAVFDLASARIEQERDAIVAEAGAALRQTGSNVCIDCGTPISADRRRVAPFATRCVECQTIHEQEKYHR